MDARALDALIGHGGRLQHLGHNAGIHHGSTCADLQAVQLGNVIGGCCGQIPLAAHFHHLVLVGGVIHAECFCRHDTGALLFLQRIQCTGNIPCQIRSRCVHIFVAGYQELARCKLDIAHGGIGLTFGSLQAAAQGNHAHLGHVALQQCIGGLRGSVCNEGNVFRTNAALLHNLVQHLNDAGGNALLCAVRGGNLDLADQFVCIVVDGDCVGKGTAHVDADTHFHSLTLL